MVAVRKFYKRTKKFFKKRYGGGVRGIARLARDVNTLKTALNTETKYHDRTDTQDAVVKSSVPYAFHPFDQLPVGNDENSRSGDQVKMLYNTTRIALEDIASVAEEDASTAATRFMMRIIAVLDTGSRYQAAMTASELRDALLQHTADGRGAILSPYKVTHTIGVGSVGDRFKILSDRVVTFDTQHAQKYIKLNLNFKRNKKRGLLCKYEEVSGGSVRQPDPRLYILCISDSTLANSKANLRIVSRSAFVDN